MGAGLRTFFFLSLNNAYTESIRYSELSHFWEAVFYTSIYEINIDTLWDDKVLYK